MVPFSAASDEISNATCDSDPNRLELVRLYNEVRDSLHELLFPYEGSPHILKIGWEIALWLIICINCFCLCWQMYKVVEENTIGLVQTSLAREPAEVDAVKNFLSIDTICKDINGILTPSQQSHPTEEKPLLIPENKSESSPKSEVLISQDDCQPESATNERKDVVIESELEKESSTGPVKEKETPSLPETRGTDIEMDEAKNDAELNEKTEKSDPAVILLDD